MFLLSELLVRIMYPEPENKGHLLLKEWNRDYKRPAFLPNAEVIHVGIPTKINSLGLRNKEIEMHKGKNILRLAMFGDSFTYGYGLQTTDTLPGQLETRLNSGGNSSIEKQVVNFGVSGVNSFEEMMYALNYGVRFNPDIIIIVWIYNDIEMNGYTLQDLAYFKLNGTVSVKRESVSSDAMGERVGSYKGEHSLTMHFWNSYEKLKKKSRLMWIVGRGSKRFFQKLGFHLKKSEEIIYADANSEGFKLSFDSLKFLHEQLSKMNIEFYIVIYPPLQSVQDDYYNSLINKKVEDFCIRHSIPYLNLFDSFRGREASRLQMSTIDAHPSRYAHEIASKAIDVYLRKKSKLFSIE